MVYEFFVRSLGWDPGHHERFRNGPENKIHIRQCSFWSSELFRVNRYCPEVSRTFRRGTNVVPPVGRGHGPMRECPGRIGPGAQGPIGPSRPKQGETLIRASRKGRVLAPRSSLPWPPAQGLEEGQGLAAPLYIKR